MIIERLFIMVLLLSISGFVFCTAFFPLERYAYRLITSKTMFFVNTIALLSFVVPFYFPVSMFDESESLFVNYNVLVFEDGTKFERIVAAIRETGIVEHLSSIWLLGVICFFVKYICEYIYLVHKVQANKFYMRDNAWMDIFVRLKDEKNVQNVTLIGCYAIFTPCSIGLKNRYIVIPASMMNAFDEEEMKFILEHELHHVIHRDLPRTLLIMLLSCLNWFNPQFYSLRIKLSDWQEAAADEAVTEGFTFKQRLRYSQLIVKVMELERAEFAAAGFSVNFRGPKFKKNIRRIKNIMKKKEKFSIYGKAAVISAALLSLILGNVVAKAADGPVNQIFSKNVEVVNSKDVEVIEETDILFDDILEDDSQDTGGIFVVFDLHNTSDTTYEIICHDTDTVWAMGQNQAEPQHVHNKVDITIKEHTKMSDGSCKTTYYAGKKCTSCGLIWKGNVIRTIIETKCPH